MDPNVREKVNIIISKITDLKKEGITDSYQLELYFIENMPDFYDNFAFLIKKLCREENQDNSFLFKMLDSIDQVNQGNTSLTNVEMKLGEELAEKYLYPALNKDKID